jgi:hypothetical protein
MGSLVRGLAFGGINFLIFKNIKFSILRNSLIGMSTGILNYIDREHDSYILYNRFLNETNIDT